MTRFKVAVVVDSTCNLTPELVARHDLHVMPQILNWEGRSLLDGLDITPRVFYERLKTAREMPTTSQPSAGEFRDFFSKVAETADGIVGVFISEQLSGTLTSARAAAEMMPGYPIEIVDSRSVSMGLGFVALAAARAAEQGLGPTEAAQAARVLAARVRVIFVLDTLEFLHRGGRIGGAQRLVGTLLALKPLLHLSDGRVEPLASVRTKRAAIERMLSVVEAECRGRGAMHAAVVDASASDEARLVYEQVAGRFKPVELIQTQLSPVVGAHAGPGTVGIAFYTE